MKMRAGVGGVFGTMLVVSTPHPGRRSASAFPPRRFAGEGIGTGLANRIESHNSHMRSP
jgi:hypothetical protein